MLLHNHRDNNCNSIYGLTPELKAMYKGSDQVGWTTKLLPTNKHMNFFGNSNVKRRPL
jgi:hypothetical protein